MLAFIKDFAAFGGAHAGRAAILTGLGALLENIGLVLLVPILAVAIDGGRGGGGLQKAAAALFRTFTIGTQSGRLTLLIAVFAVLLILRAAVISLRESCVAHLEIGFVEAQRSAIMRRLAAARWEQVLQLRYARVAHVMSADVERIGVALHLLIQLAVAGVLLFCQCALMMLLAPAFATAVLAVVALALLVAWRALPRSYRLGAHLTGDYLALSHAVGQLLGGLKLAISQNLQSAFVTEFEETIDALKARQRDFAWHRANAGLVFATALGLAGAALLLTGFVVAHLEAPILLTLLLILGRMNGPATTMLQGEQLLAHSLPAYEKVRELADELDQQSVSRELPSPYGKLPIDGAIVFRGVTFFYGDGGAASGSEARGVRGIEISIEPGEVIAITGPSGAGKTTFADLLVGLIAPQAGSITIGGIPLDGAALAAWRNRVSYVTQDPFLFHDTIRRNLLWANPSAGEADLWDALAVASADTFVRAMRNGLDTVVGERGMLMSGGERQRIGLARAIVRKPRLLVLDEATNAIDLDTQRRILERLCRLKDRPTIVIISHHPEALEMCERVFKFECGELVMDRTNAFAASASPRAAASRL